MTKTRAIILGALAASLTVWGASSIVDLISPQDTCYSSVTVEGTIDRYDNLTVNVTSGGATICANVQEGGGCSLTVANSSDTVTVTFDDNSSQYEYLSASGNVLSNLSTTTLSPGGTSQVAFAVAAANSSDVLFEGDPKIQVKTGSCG